MGELKKRIEGDLSVDEEILALHSHDASIFEVKPELVIFPKNSKDVSEVVKFVNENKASSENISVTGRSAGTDMSGGPLTQSISISFTKYMNRLFSIKNKTARFQPGMYYRDFEDETLARGLIFPSYPASKEICAMGGIVNNNSGGEKSLEYGKTENFITSYKIVLSDGKEHIIKPLSETELDTKMKKRDFEGEIYRKMFNLISKNYDLIKAAKPKVSKNSAGYYLWNVYDKENKIFDLTRLIVGAQGTLGIVTEATLKLVETKRFSEMMIIFLNNLDHLGDVINDVLPLEPESFETYDDHTLKLAVKFFPEFAKKLGTKNAIETGWHFLPEFFMVASGGVPKLILQVEFTGDSRHELGEKIEKLRAKLTPYKLKMRVAPNKNSEKKYWSIRRESFNLLRQKIRDKHTAPFIDDFAVKPEYLKEFLPKLNKIFEKYPELIYTIAGHLGDGNFHIIPLMNLQDPKQRAIIPKLADEVFNLVLKYHGTTSGEHNDGIIRTPYLRKMYGSRICRLFEKTKEIFDPDNIFNPGKKVRGNINFAMDHIRSSW
ncbi:FAD-binding oxidoreductase [Candidatus Curtissbacteria bacterium]|nr:FAD-binding oxidoreductase [Candidatus Curtissbacteria bacterium]